jgi:hypothetical protein
LFFKSQSTYEIIQLDTIDSPKFNKSIQENRPTIITNIPQYDVKDTHQFKYTIIEQPYPVSLPFSSHLHSPLTILSKHSISMLPKDAYRSIVSTDFDRNFYFVTTGVVHFYLFHPKYTPQLYKNNKYDSTYKHSDYDMFVTSDKYPKSKQAKYIEIIVRENTLIYIPRFYWYCYKSIEDSVMINIKSETIFSFIINLRHIGKHIQFSLNKSLNPKNKIT